MIKKIKLFQLQQNIAFKQQVIVDLEENSFAILKN